MNPEKAKRIQATNRFVRLISTIGKTLSENGNPREPEDSGKFSKLITPNIFILI